MPTNKFRLIYSNILNFLILREFYEFNLIYFKLKSIKYSFLSRADVVAYENVMCHTTCTYERVCAHVCLLRINTIFKIFAISLTRRDREVVDFTRSRVKNKVRIYQFWEFITN